MLHSGWYLLGFVAGVVGILAGARLAARREIDAKVREMEGWGR